MNNGAAGHEASKSIRLGAAVEADLAFSQMRVNIGTMVTMVQQAIEASKSIRLISSQWQITVNQ